LGSRLTQINQQYTLGTCWLSTSQVVRIINAQNCSLYTH